MRLKTDPIQATPHRFFPQLACCFNVGFIPVRKRMVLFKPLPRPAEPACLNGCTIKNTEQTVHIEKGIPK
jgi:hypothetical protein